MQQRTLPYSVVDVFAERALEGNPLAIFHDANSLTTAEMQALARETNLAETTFVLPAEDESAGVRVRIFTTQEELRFAGHPTLGTASWLYWNHPVLKGAAEITLALDVGPITVRFTAAEEGELGVRATMRTRRSRSSSVRATSPSRSSASTVSVTERGAKPSSAASRAWFIGPH